MVLFGFIYSGGVCFVLILFGVLLVIILLGLSGVKLEM